MCAKGRRWLGALSYSNATETKMGIIHAMLCKSTKYSGRVCTAMHLREMV